MHDIIESIASGEAAAVWFSLTVPVVIKSALILGAAGIIAHLLRSSAAALRHLVWLTAMVGVLLLPALSLVVPAIQVPMSEPNLHAFTSTPSQGSDLGPAATPLPSITSPERASPDASSSPASIDMRPALAATKAAASDDANPPAGIRTILANLTNVHWATWLFVIWIFGTLFLLARLVFAHVAAWLLVRGARRVDDDDWHLRLERHARTFTIDRRVKLRECEWLDVPVTVGTIFPVVVLPRESEDWDDPTRDAVLLHELAHIRRLDCLAQTVVEFVRAVLWVNPLTWYAESAMRTERERACDDLVITNGTRASSYAQTLLALARSLRGEELASAAVMAMARRSDLEGRLLDILDGGPRMRTVNRVGAALAVVIVLSVVVPVAALSPAMAQDAPNREPTSEMRVDVPHFNYDFNFDFDHDINHDYDHDFDYDFDYDFNYEFDYDFEAGLPGTDLERGLRDLGRELERDLRDLDRDLEHDMRELERDLEFAYQGSEISIDYDRDNLDKVAIGFADAVIANIAGVLSRLEIEFDGKVDLAGVDASNFVNITDTLTIEQIVQLARYGVDAEYIESLRAAGLDELSFDALMTLGRQDVEPEFVANLFAAGYNDLSVEEIVSMHRYDVDSSVANEYAALGLSPAQMVEVARLDVDLDEIQGMMDLGFTGLGFEDFLVVAARYGVDEDLMTALASGGFRDIDIEGLVSLAKKGVDEDLILGLDRLGYDDVSVDDIIELARYDLDVDCIEELNEAGYGRQPIETIIRFNRYDVDADFIRGFAEAGIRDLSADDLIDLRKHDMSVDEFKRMRAANR